MFASFLAFISAPFVETSVIPSFNAISKGIRLIFAFSVFIFIASTLPLQAQDEVSIPDANLLEAIRDELGKPTGEITKGDMARLTNLRALWASISDLTGLENAINLSSLKLDGNEIVDLSPLSNLTSLTTLWLWDNEIVDLVPLSNLINLSTLYLWENEIVDLAPLSGLTNLSTLYLFGNKIVDLGPLSDLANLSSLNLGFNEIVDLDPLSGLTNLSFLMLGENEIVDLAPLSDLTNLSTLYLGWNKIVDLSPLSSLVNLSALSLLQNDIVNIVPLSDLTNLSTLDLSSNADLHLVAGSSQRQIVDTFIIAGVNVTFDDPRLKMRINVDKEGRHVEIWPVPEGVAISLKSSVDLKVWIAVEEGSESIANGRYRFNTDSDVDAFYKIVVK